MTPDDRIRRARTKSRIVAVALVFCAGVLAPAAVPATAHGYWIIGVALGFLVVACLAMAVRLVRRRRTTDGD